MAIIDMDFAMGGGEHYEETVLWTNPSPTSAQGSQEISLASAISNFDSLKFIIYSDTSHTKETHLILQCDEYAESGSATNNTFYTFTTPSVYINSNVVARGIRYVSDNKLNIGTCNSISGGSGDNSKCILYQIIGLKKVGGSADTKISIVADHTQKIGSITTAGGSYTATEDCVMIIKTMASTSAGEAQIGISEPTGVADMGISFHLYNTSQSINGYMDTYDTAGIFIPKGTVITTRSITGASYDIGFFKMKF